jgi:hypothetical protein
MPLPNDLVPVGPVAGESASALPPDLVAVPPATATSALPEDLTPVEAPKAEDDKSAGLLQGISSLLFGNNPSEGVKVGPLVQNDAGDFYTDEKGDLKPITTAQFIAKDPKTGRLAVFQAHRSDTVMGKLRDLASALSVGMATNIPEGMVTRGISQGAKVAEEAAQAVPEGAPAAAKLPEDLVPVEAPTATAAPEAASVAEAAPATVPGEQIAGNINLANLNTTEDVKDYIRQAAKQNGDFLAERRGVQTWEMTAEQARVLAEDPDKLLTKEIGSGWNAAEVDAIRQMLVDQATTVRKAARVAATGTDADKAAFIAESAKLAGLKNSVAPKAAAAAAEVGRALNIHARIKSAMGDAEAISELLDQAKASGKLDMLLEGVNKLDNQDAAAVAEFVTKSWAAQKSDKIVELWINALLSGPKTHVANILSNTLVSAWAVPEHMLSVGISKLTGSGMSASEIPAHIFGTLEGAVDGIKAAGKALKSEEATFGAGKLADQAHPKAIGGWLGRVVRAPGTALMAEDEFFKAIAYRQKINELAARSASQAGLKGRAWIDRVAEVKAAPPEAIANEARDFALTQTFTNAPGMIARDVIRWANQYRALKPIVPFVRTPVNIAKFSAKRSLLAPLFKDVQADLKAGGIARDQALARMALGTAVSAATMYFVRQGLVTGQGPTDPRERARMYLAGRQPYSVKIGDSYYSYSRLEPIATLVGVAADFSELYDHMNGEERSTIPSLIFGSIAKNVTSKTFLSGMSELMQAAQDPDRYGAKYIQGLIGTVVPTAVAQYAQTKDPYLRQARSILDQIRSRLPGFREDLPVKRNFFGEPIKLQGGYGPDIASPIFTSKENKDPVVKEMLKLSILPSPIARTVRGVELTPDEYDRLQVITGTVVHTALTKVVTSQGWQSLPKPVRADIMNKIITRAREAGRDYIAQQPSFTDRLVQHKTTQAIERVSPTQ